MSLIDLGISAAKQARLHLAIEYFQQCVQINPSLFKCHQALAEWSLAIGNPTLGIPHAIQLANLVPCADSSLLLAVIYESAKDLTNAKQVLLNACQIYNDNKLKIALGLIHLKTGEYNTARDILRQPVYHVQTMILQEKAVSELEGIGLMWYLRLCLDFFQWDEYERLISSFERLTEQQLRTESPVSVTPFFSCFALDWVKFNRKIASQYAKKCLPYNPNTIYPVGKKINQKPKITVGYISSDFYDHPLGLLINSLFSHHDSEKFETHVYSTSGIEDSYQAIIKKSCDFYHDISQYNFQDAAKYIYNNQLDILVDLSGYTADAKPKILAYQPAPIQAHLGGYGSTLGADFIQYYFGSKAYIPDNIRSIFKETIVDLPHAYFATKLFDTKNPNLKKSDYYLPDDQFVFGCFSKPYRIDKADFIRWMKILQQVPNSVLWLLATNTEPSENILDIAREYDINPKRIIFREPKRITADWHNQLMDVWLDSHKFSSGTSTILNLMVEVPVITMPGPYPHQRTAYATLAAANLTELAVDSEQAYIDMAVKLATDSSYLKSVRHKIKASHSSALFNPKLFIEDLEAKYKTLIQNFN